MDEERNASTTARDPSSAQPGTQTAIVRFLFIVLAYVTTGWLGLQIPYVGSHITLIWLPAGIAVGALLRWGRAMWLAVYVGALVVNLLVAPTWPLAAGIAVGNTLAPLLVAWGLESFALSHDFAWPRDVFLLVAFSALGAAVSALGGVSCLLLAGEMPWGEGGFAWLSWWMGDLIGVLVCAPLLLSVSLEDLTRTRHLSWELLSWLLVAGVGIVLALGLCAPQSHEALRLEFMVLPSVVWAGLRFGLRGSSFAALFFSLTVVAVTSAGLGVFAVHGDLGLWSMWVFLGTIVITGLMMAAIQARRLRLEQEIRDLAFYDPLTELPNRRLLLDRLQQAVGFGARGRTCALLFIDLDGFKGVNDTFGHDAGDGVLREVAQRLKSRVRETDLVGRLAGDEFLAILYDLGKDTAEATALATRIGHKLLTALGEPYLMDARSCSVTSSIGVTLLSDQTVSVEQALKQADDAMYWAKRAGRNTLRVFEAVEPAAPVVRTALRSATTSPSHRRP